VIPLHFQADTRRKNSDAGERLLPSRTLAADAIYTLIAIHARRVRKVGKNA